MGSRAGSERFASAFHETVVPVVRNGAARLPVVLRFTALVVRWRGHWPFLEGERASRQHLQASLGAPCHPQLAHRGSEAPILPRPCPERPGSPRKAVAIARRALCGSPPPEPAPLRCPQLVVRRQTSFFVYRQRQTRRSRTRYVATFSPLTHVRKVDVRWLLLLQRSRPQLLAARACRGCSPQVRAQPGHAAGAARSRTRRGSARTEGNLRPVGAGGGKSPQAPEVPPALRRVAPADERK
jgi:hypothetical protein